VLGEALEGDGDVGFGGEIGGEGLGFAGEEEGFVMSRQRQFVLLCCQLQMKGESMMSTGLGGLKTGLGEEGGERRKMRYVRRDSGTWS